MRSWEYALLAPGVLAFAAGVFLMVEGHILGERTTGIATLVALVGTTLILTTSNAIILRKARKS